MSKTTKRYATTLILFSILFSIGCDNKAAVQKKQSANSKNSYANRFQPKLPLTYPNFAVPEYSPLPDFRPISENVEVAEVEITNGPVLHNGSRTGFANKVFIARPRGEFQPNSLPVYFLAAAGATVLTGRDLTEGDWQELIPWAEAGFVAVGYEIDGQLQEDRDADYPRAFEAYKNAQAGLINARNAVDFTSKRLPEVDDMRMYTGGHSSGGTQAFLLAQLDPRIKAVVAFNAVIDKRTHLNDPSTSGDYLEMLYRSSPRSYEDQLRVPIFLYHTLGDRVVLPAQSEMAHSRYQRRGLNSTLILDSGNHYDPMLERGIPQAIEWLSKIDSKIEATNRVRPAS